MTNARGGGGADVPYAPGAMHAQTSTNASNGIPQSARWWNRRDPDDSNTSDRPAGSSIAMSNGTGEMAMSSAVGSQRGVAPRTRGTTATMPSLMKGMSGRQNMK